MKNFSTPLRYPGGKARFTPFIASILKCNEISGHYFEPFAGGAGVAISLLIQGSISHIHINDADPAIYDFWVSITQFPERILQLLRDTPITIEQWHYWREILRGNIDTTQEERGFATLFMNRTNRSGILKGGVIGGRNQTGNYTLDARFNKDNIHKRIEKIASLSKNISVYNEDALEILQNCTKFLPEDSLIYLDPPYYVKGKGLYRNFYEHDDHVKIAQFLCETSFTLPWIASYDNVTEIHKMYSASRKMSYNLKYTAQKRYIGSEIMFFSDQLNIPEKYFTTNFTKIA